MNWSCRKYRIRLGDGSEESVTGTANGLFGLSASGVLTHLKTGYQVAKFPDQQSSQAAGDYLATAYAEEFEALNRATKESMTYDQIRALAETIDLNRKINEDSYFNQQLTAAGVNQDDGNQYFL